MKKLIKAFSLIFLISLSMLFINGKVVVQAAEGYYIQSGSFNSESSAQTSLDKYLTSKGLWGEVKYYFRSGAFPERYQAENVVNSMANDGLWAEVLVDGNSFRVSSGSFNSESSAKEALNKYLTQKGLWGEVKYYFRSGTFPERYQAQKVVDEMASDGLWAEVIGNDNSSNKGAQVVNYAKTFLGTPYVWGGDNPNGFDCSGLTQYVYKNFGYSIGRSTYDQINRGIGVSRDNLQPGDLVFTDAGHVGIYVGNNQMIHSPKPGQVVRIETIWSFYAARRIIY